MASTSTSLLAKLKESGLVGRAPSYLPVFEGEINMQATTELHRQTFLEILQYMEVYIAEYAVELPDSTSRWVPVDYIKHLYVHDKNFRFRLSRFLNGLTKRTYRVEDKDVVEELGLGNIGSYFLSWDMVMTVMLHET